MHRHFLCSVAIVTLSISTTSSRGDEFTPQHASLELHRVLDFHRQHVGYHGAWLWRYSADLKHQEGEEIATKTSGWTQPPGTPFIGEAFLNAWQLTGDRVCLDAAVEAAYALVDSMLNSGGWASHFDLAQPGRSRYSYRTEGPKSGKRNSTTFDDNKSQSALMLLMHVDEALDFKDGRIHEAVEYSLQRILLAQYPNGAWPQQFTEPPDAARFPVLTASYPESWPREHPQEKYVSFYTLNDNNMAYIVDMLFEANRIYGRRDCFDAAVKTGEFFLLAQMTEPQPAWAQQYDTEMHPVWARRFEPPAVTGGESQSVLKTLIRIYRFTGQKRFIATIPAAIAYFRRSQLPDGRLARFYELRTNTPLFFTKDYRLTESDADVPTHYSFKVSSKLDSLEREYRKALATPKEKLRPLHRHIEPVRRSSKLAAAAGKVVAALDDRGAWVESGTMDHLDKPLNVIDMRTFAKNLEALAEYAGSTE